MARSDAMHKRPDFPPQPYLLRQLRSRIELVEKKKLWGRGMVTLIALALTTAALAQAPPPDAITGNASPAPASPPVRAYQQFPIKAGSTVFQLRFPHVYFESETVTLNGQPLRRNVDYTINYGGGSLSLIIGASPGQVLAVTYQHDSPLQFASGLPPVLGPITPTQMAGFGSELSGVSHLDFGHNLLGGGSQMSLGFVKASGAVLFAGNGGANPLNGLFENPQSGPGRTDSRFIVESVTSKLWKGNFQFNYQDISQDFGNFGSAKSAGFSDSDIAQLQKEAGLKKIGFAMSDINFGSTKISDSFQKVSDGSGSIDWKSFALESGGLKLSYDSHRVAPGFARFGDLGMANGDQLMKEAGLSFQNVGGSYTTKGTAVSFSSNQVSDQFGQRLSKTDLNYAHGGFKLDIGEKSISPYFSDLAALSDADQKEWANQLGVSRRWLSLQAAPLQKGADPIAVDALQLKTQTGSFQSESFSGGIKNWSLVAMDNKVGAGFGLGGLLPDADLDKTVQSIAKLYSSTPIPTGPGDRAAFLSGPGIERTGFRLLGQPFKDWHIDAEAVKLKGATDGASLASIAINSKNLDLNVKQEHMGANFVEATQLLSFEQQRLGNMPGVDKTDASLSLRMAGAKKLTATYMDSGNPTGKAQRTSIDYSDKKIDVSYTNRDVDPGMSVVGGMPDPEGGLLSQLTGFKDQVWNVKWTPNSKLNLMALWENQHDDASDQSGYDHVINLTWNPNKTTSLLYTYNDSRSSNPLDVLFQNRLSLLQFTKDFGKYGKLQYIHSDQDVTDLNGAPAPVTAGPQAPPINPALPQGESSQDYISYQTNLDKNTSLKTEESQTRYSNGTQQDMSVNTVSHALTKHFGISYSNLNIDGLGNDQHRNNYGFWLDLSKGVRFSYGFVREITPFGGYSTGTTIGATSGVVGPFQVQSGSYNVNDQIDQTTSNFALKSSKPFQLGIIKDLNFNLGYTEANQPGTFMQSNRLFNVSGKIGSNTFMAEYKSQLDFNGQMGIDRFISFQTDQNPKKWIVAGIKIKQRDTPEYGKVMIRDYNVTIRPLKNLEISNQLLTNPEEQFRPDVLLGSVTSPWRSNKYKLSYHSSASTTIGATWEEQINDYNHDSYRTAGLDVELFKNSGSPLTLWYGMEQGNGSTHESASRYYLKFFQRPGPNQSLNIFVGNISWAYNNGTPLNKNNWTVQASYELKFW